MKAIVYFRGCGQDFDGAALGRQIAPYLKGATFQSAQATLGGWRSIPTTVESLTGEDELIAVATSAVSALNKIGFSGAGHADLVIARTPETADDLCGLYFSPRLLELLAEAGAGIDYDVVSTLQI